MGGTRVPKGSKTQEPQVGGGGADRDALTDFGSNMDRATAVCATGGPEIDGDPHGDRLTAYWDDPQVRGMAETLQSLMRVEWHDRLSGELDGFFARHARVDDTAADNDPGKWRPQPLLHLTREVPIAPATAATLGWPEGSMVTIRVDSTADLVLDALDLGFVMNTASGHLARGRTWVVVQDCTGREVTLHDRTFEGSFSASSIGGGPADVQLSGV